ncbi:MAG: hypothetical protein Fur002_23170 [Anaerolineales bacterium]
MNAYEDIQPLGYVPPGWDEWDAFLGKNIHYVEDAGSLQYFYDFTLSENGKIAEYPRSGENFSADVLTRKALNFIRESRNQPFFLTVGYYNPHSPYIPAPRHKNAFRSGEDYWDWVQYRPPSFNEKDVRDKPDYISKLYPLSENEIDVAHKQILRSLLSVDDGVASILAALKAAGLEKNTVIVYISDNGSTLGDHRFGVSKNCPYEACVTIPFIVYAPGYYAPRIETRIVSNTDLAPTFASMAKTSLPTASDGMDLTPLLTDPSAAWRKALLLEHWRTEEGVGSIIPNYYAIRSESWKYVEYETGEKELYDLVHDPYELQNAAGAAACRDIQARLAQQLTDMKSK